MDQRCNAERNSKTESAWLCCNSCSCTMQEMIYLGDRASAWYDSFNTLAGSRMGFFFTIAVLQRGEDHS